ncbi:MAG: hypothetical protein EBZ69_00975 [Alphaproteobacteria bacterium]|nr:hypothetical protein [Alphaproteobacteria bacterium]NDG03836.1 hypothetical protein [Alphaproteobacteria bacterium]
MVVLPKDVGTVNVIEDFITPAEEQTLLAQIEAGISTGTKRQKGAVRNVVQRWGSSVPYRNDILSDVIPEHFQFLLDRLVAQNLVAHRPDSITMNQYLIKQAILAHIDLPEGGPVITVLSLKSPATMLFRYRQTERMFAVPLPPRSLVQMRDEIRYNWTHEIQPVLDTRYSLVFRCSSEVI